MDNALRPTPATPIAGAPRGAIPATARAAHALRRTAVALTLAAGLLAGGALGGCATPRASRTVYRTLPPKTSVADVQVFTDGRPSRPFEEVGLIEVSKFGRVDYGRLIERARGEAATMGADAILVTRETEVVSTNTSGGVSAPNKRGGRTVNSSTTTLDRQRVTVTAIVWTDR
ncbi:MAG: hypothetical protein MUF00_18305 [Gemmatimonadaceae bacterium]|nr:hypothetical protein [Gemmatimonadaceae bacterium]